MKRWKGFVLLTILILVGISGCTSQEANVWDDSQDITVVSREVGSGTRGAFTELFGIEQKTASGEPIDHTTVEASITNNTSVMMATVSGNKYAIGYVSLGSLNDAVKAIAVDEAAPTVDNIQNGSYKVARPFHIVTKGEVSAVACDFIEFIVSGDGQKVVEEAGYIPVSYGSEYSSDQSSGKVVVAGSSSVTPVMEKLREAYLTHNPNATIEVQQSDSTTGVNSVISGIVDIGMASRSLRASELEEGLEPVVIAMDGIAVIVNNDNPIDNLASEQVKAIFTGETTLWADVI